MNPLTRIVEHEKADITIASVKASQSNSFCKTGKISNIERFIRATVIKPYIEKDLCSYFKEVSLNGLHLLLANP